MAVDRRSELVAAGVRLAVAQRFQDVLSGVDTRSITEEAGVTTGSFFHHFRNRAHFAEAVTDWFVQAWAGHAEAVVAEIDRSHAGGPGVRRAAEVDWESWVDEEHLSGVQHLLFLTQGQPISADTSVTGADVLRTGYGTLQQLAEPAYEEALRALALEVLPPFTVAELAVALTALGDGIQMRRRVDPDAVRDDLYADLILALAVGMTRPAGTAEGPTELAEHERALTPRAAPTRAEVDAAERARIADAAAGVFDERPLSEILIGDVAAAAGVGTDVVYAHFDGVGDVAAWSWRRHLPGLEKVAASALEASAEPEVIVERVLSRFVEVGRAHRAAVEALVAAMPAAARSGEPDGGCPALRSITELFVAPLLDLRRRGRLRRGVDTWTASWSLVHLAAGRLLLGPDDAVERIVDDALGLVLDGVLDQRTAG